MTTRSAVLAARNAAGVGQTLMFTVPAGETWIVKDARVYNGNAGAIAVSLSCYRPSASTGAFLVNDSAIASGITDVWTGWLVMEPNDSLYLSVSATPVQCWVSGAKLDGVAPP